MDDRVTATVKRFNASKDYGFITMPEGPDIFVHYSAFEMEGFGNLEQGQQVEFSIEKGPKGLQVANVKVIQ